jgi:cytochrome c oxidase subunit 2
LETAGAEAAEIAVLFWTMAAAGMAIWVGVVTLLIYASRRNRPQIEDAAAGRLIFCGGALFPAAVLVVLLAYALWLMPSLRPFALAGSPSGLRIEVTGRQFWWEVVYRMPDGAIFRTSNEIVLPVGRRVELSLTSTDVIHSFWIPSMGGKMDMIPGRTNRLSLEATKAGVFRGPCAEFCGTSHALMAFSAVAIPTGQFERWAAQQAAPSPGAIRNGAATFLKHGCGACHAVTGTQATGQIGPDLSHIGSRLTVGAGILANTEDNLARFIAEPGRIKPGSRMPAFSMLPEQEIRAIANWLKGLE